MQERSNFSINYRNHIIIIKLRCESKIRIISKIALRSSWAAKKDGKKNKKKRLIV